MGRLTQKSEERASPNSNPVSQSPQDLKEALGKCRMAADQGYELAKRSLAGANDAMEAASKSLAQYLSLLNGQGTRTPQIVDTIREQFESARAELERLNETSRKRLEERRKCLDKFSIVLFGRTLAGKSTLMEIWTRGDGRSIGAGAQRTTRDVRSYLWHGLRIVDVPGIAAFDGAEDEELALEAASQADLVIFLITDDAPQAVEAEFLGRVRRLGKPIIGICNVKVAIDDPDDLRLFLRNPDKAFDRARLDKLLDQFHRLCNEDAGEQRVHFTSTHLRAMYLAQKAKNAKQKAQLQTASRFGAVESLVIREVVGRGTFLRMKTFVEEGVVPMVDTTDLLLRFSAKNSTSGRVMLDEKRNFDEWHRGYRLYAQKRIETVVSEAMNGLRDAVQDFAEEYYDKRTAGQQWERVANAAGVQRKIENLQNEIVQDCIERLKEAGRELQSELALAADFSSAREIAMDKIFDAKRAWNWGTAIVMGSLGLLSLFVSGPIGWAAVAVAVGASFISGMLDDREARSRDARRKLEQRLVKNIDGIERDLLKKLKRWLQKDICDRYLYVFSRDLEAIIGGLFSLADTQRKLAWKLNAEQKALSRELVRRALSDLRANALEAAINDVARVPGYATMLLIKVDTKFPEHIRRGLQNLLGEHVWFVIDTKNRISLIGQAIGRNCDRRRIRIEEKIEVVRVPASDKGGRLDPDRVRLAQQLVSLHVMGE